MTQEAFWENSVKELGRLEAQLASLRQELAALTQKQSSVADEMGLIPQKIQAVRADVSGNHLRPCQAPFLPGPSTLGLCSRSLCHSLDTCRADWHRVGSVAGVLPVSGRCSGR
jgi:hypothetical protein